MKPNNLGRLPEIEVLRGYAIFMTLCTHFLWGIVPLNLNQTVVAIFDRIYPAFGVDIFFTISGFVIALNLIQNFDLTQCKTFPQEAWRFWKRRMWRLYPALWFTVFLSFLLSVIFHNKGLHLFGEPDVIGMDGAAAVLHYFNFYVRGCDTQHACGNNQVFWTLSLEEQFYFILPFVILLSGKHFVKVLGVLLVVQLLIPRSTYSVLNHIRSDGFIIGVLLAVAHSKGLMQRCEPTWMGKAVVRFLVMASLFVAALFFDRLTMQPNVYYARSICTLLTASMVWFAIYNKGYVISAGYLQKFWIYIGSRSYVIYLTHFIAFSLSVEFLNAAWNSQSGFLDFAIPYQNTAMFLAALLSTWMLAEFVHRFIEKPLMIRALGNYSRPAQALCSGTS